jgi:pimeloyl-ACP methyl ester carboxylesterase
MFSELAHALGLATAADGAEAAMARLLGPRAPAPESLAAWSRKRSCGSCALVFLAGWALDEGESIEQLLGLNEGSLVLPALQQVPFTNPDGSGGVDLYLDQEAFPATFAADVDPETARVMAATQRPWSAAALSAPSGPPAWKSIPSWYLLGTEDKAIPPATQRFMAERATATIEEVAASHASMVSQPDVATKLIVTAVNATVGAIASG